MRRLLTVTLLCSLAAVPVLAGAKGAARSNDVPSRYLPDSLDGELVQVFNQVDGRAWSAWAYRNGAEYDLAVSVSGAPGMWSGPRLMGLDDGLDQQNPALAVDTRGAVYLAYSSGDGAVIVRALQPYSVVWSDGVRIESVRPLSHPTLLVSGDSLVLGYREGERVGLTALELLPVIGTTGSSIYDGPDPIGGREDDDDGKEDGEGSDSNGSAPPRDGVELLPVGDAAGNYDNS